MKLEIIILNSVIIFTNTIPIIICPQQKKIIL